MGARLFNVPPAARYVHPMVARRPPGTGDHDYGIDVANDNATRYLHWVADLVKPHLGESVLEVGAGIGSITQHLAPGREVVAADISDFCIDSLHKRFAGADNVEVVQADLRTWDPGRSFDSIVMINVLEHIEDDVAALTATVDALEPGGELAVLVPAHPYLFGRLDRRFGHYRRYTRPRLRALISDAGAELTSLRSINALGVPGWWLAGRTEKMDITEGSLRVYETLVRLWRPVEDALRPPVGLSLVARARKPRT